MVAALIAYRETHGGAWPTSHQWLREADAPSPQTVDMSLEYERLGPEHPPTHRRIVTIGRPIETRRHRRYCSCRGIRPTGGWAVHGEAADRAASAEASMRQRILDALPDGPPGITEQELADRSKVDKRKVSTPLREVVDEGAVAREGGGRANDPYLYSRAPKPPENDVCPDEGQTPGQTSAPLPVGGQTRADR